MFTCVLDCFQSYQYPNLSEGADRVGGQLAEKEKNFRGVTRSGRVWRKVPESGVPADRTPGRCAGLWAGPEMEPATARVHRSLRAGRGSLSRAPRAF